MCLIVVSDLGFSDLPEAWLERAFDQNPDGFGAMWIDAGRVRTHHAMPRDAGELAALMAALPHDRTVAVHLRQRTAGTVSRDNLHPFPVRHARGTLWLMHNGTFEEHAGCPVQADTRRYIRDRLEPLLQDASCWTECRAEIARHAAPSASRLVLLDDAGRLLLVDGPVSGLAADGRWYSKLHCAPGAAPADARRPAARAPGGRAVSQQLVKLPARAARPVGAPALSLAA